MHRAPLHFSPAVITLDFLAKASASQFKFTSLNSLALASTHWLAREPTVPAWYFRMLTCKYFMALMSIHSMYIWCIVEPETTQATGRQRKFA